MSKSENGIGAKVYTMAKGSAIYLPSAEYPGCSNVEYLHDREVILLEDYEELQHEYVAMLAEYE